MYNDVPLLIEMIEIYQYVYAYYGTAQDVFCDVKDLTQYWTTAAVLCMAIDMEM